MKALRIIGLIIVSILLLVSLIGVGTTVTLGKSLTYNNVKNSFSGIVKGTIKENIGLSSIIGSSLPYMQEYCENHSEFSFKRQGETLTIPCSKINQGSKEVVSSILDQVTTTIVENYYYKDYDCNLVQCIQQQQVSVLISEKAKNFWYGKYYLFLGISIFLAILAFLLSSPKSYFFFITGGLTIGSSIIVSQIPNIVTSAIEKSLSSQLSMLSQLGISPSIIVDKIIGIFFTESNTIFLRLLIIGILLIITGILFKVFNLDSKLFKKKTKENSKEKTNREKSKKEKQSQSTKQGSKEKKISE